MVAPTRVQQIVPTLGFESTTTPKTTPTFDVQNGDLLVCMSFSPDNADPLSLPTWTGTGTWTLRQSVVVANYCTAYLYTCAVTATATGVTVSQARTSGSIGYSYRITQWRNHGGLGATSKANTTGAPSLALTTTGANSAVMVGSSDFQALDGASRVWRTVNGNPMIEAFYQNVIVGSSWGYTVYGGYTADAGAAGAKTLGLTAPTGQTYSIVAAEIIGTTVAAPTAAFTASQLSAATGTPISFTDTSTGTPTSWAWDFGDGTTSTAQNPTKAYSAAGTYTVKLTATSAGGSTTATKTGLMLIQTVLDPLATWKTALASAKTAPANVTTIGTSISEGHGASTRQNRWLDQALTTIRSRYTPAVSSGLNYLPAFYAVTSPYSPWGQTETSDSGTINTGTTRGNLGLRDLTLATGAVSNWTITGTSVDIWCSGGTFTYAIDGGTPVSVTSTQHPYTKVSGVNLGANSSHTLAITATTGPVILSGFTVYVGDATIGVHGFDGAHYGFSTSNYTAVLTDYALTVAQVSPDLVLIEMGTNENGNNVPPATFQASLQQLVDMFKGQTKVPSILLISLYVQYDEANYTYRWTQYKQAMQNIVNADPGRVGILDLSASMPQTTTSGTGYYRPDGYHPNDSGHAKIAQLVADQVAPTNAGTIAATGPTPTAQAAAATTVTGSVAATGPRPTITATADLAVTGTGTATGPTPVVSAAGTTVVTGAPGAVGPRPTVQATGVLQSTGAVAAAGPTPTVSAAGQVGSAVAGAVAAVGPAPAVAIAGTTAVSGASAATGPTPVVVAAGFLAIAGTVAALAPAPTSHLTAALATTGTAAAVGPTPTAAITGTTTGGVEHDYQLTATLVPRRWKGALDPVTSLETYPVGTREHQALTVLDGDTPITNYQVALLAMGASITEAAWTAAESYAGKTGVWIDGLMRGIYCVWARTGLGAPNERAAVFCGFVEVTA